MVEILGWVGDGFRVVVGTMIMLIPGIVFWLVVVGIIAMIQRWGRAGLYQVVQNKIWERLKAVSPGRWQGQ